MISFIIDFNLSCSIGFTLLKAFNSKVLMLSN